MTNRYEAPLSSRYASEYMSELFSSYTGYQAWHKLWVALAKTETDIGLSITQAQVDAVTAFVNKIKPLIANADGKSAEINR